MADTLSRPTADHEPPALAQSVAIVGSRDFPDMEKVRAYVRRLGSRDTVVSGGARGVDTVAEEEARKRGLNVVVYPANWAEYGKRAGYLRNCDIVANCDRVVAFWDGVSKGTKHTIDIAKKQGKPVEVVKP